MYFAVHCTPTDVAMAQWRSTVWGALYNAAQNAFYAQQQAINAQISALQNKLVNVGTLTLRREENDEIMKCALRWLMGNDVEFMPQNVVDMFNKTAGTSVNYGIDFTWTLVITARRTPRTASRSAAGTLPRSLPTSGRGPMQSAAATGSRARITVMARRSQLRAS